MSRLASAATALFFLSIAVFGGYVWKLHKQLDPALDRPINIILSAPEIEDHVDRFVSQLGSDAQGYSNHCHRVMTFAMHFLGPADEATTAQRRRIMGAALAYHDIALWSDNDMAYLEPSMERAKADLPGLGFTEDEMKIILDIIFWHHKMSPFEDNTTTIPDHVAMVEAVRRADILDFTLGFVSMGMPQKHIVAVTNKMPNAGFHVALLNMGPKIHGFNLAGYAGIFTIYKK